MAYAPPDPKKVQARENALRDAAAKEIAAIEERERQIKREMRSCYHEHSPKQIAHAGVMIRNHHDGARRVSEAVQIGANCWKRIGVSNGGKQRRNLYICVVT